MIKEIQKISNMNIIQLTDEEMKSYKLKEWEIVDVEISKIKNKKVSFDKKDRLGLAIGYLSIPFGFLIYGAYLGYYNDFFNFVGQILPNIFSVVGILYFAGLIIIKSNMETKNDK